MQGRLVWLARLLIGMVFIFNVQCAVAFLVSPENYAPAFELDGVSGEGMVQGLGVLFMMWNVPYAVALWHPVRYFTSLSEAVVMQAIGVVGETLIWLGLPVVHTLARGAVLRFIVFDGGGLLLLGLAWLLVRSLRKSIVV